jgi:hypothetical protein
MSRPGSDINVMMLGSKGVYACYSMEMILYTILNQFKNFLGLE